MSFLTEQQMLAVEQRYTDRQELGVIRSIEYRQRSTRIVMDARALYTGQVRGLVIKMRQQAPGLEYHDCHNAAGLPFVEEMQNTELGHAFEHLILEKLRLLKIYGRGLTRWNWKRDPMGRYQITIYSGQKAKVSIAIEQARQLMRIGALTS